MMFFLSLDIEYLLFVPTQHKKDLLSNENLEPSLGASSRYYLMKIHYQGLLPIYGEGHRARKKVWTMKKS
jgi:hypothetical protein